MKPLLHLPLQVSENPTVPQLVQVTPSVRGILLLKHSVYSNGRTACTVDSMLQHVTPKQALQAKHVEHASGFFQ
jgi:hypothetical protein